MVTFKAIVIPNNRRKDGTYPVKIRVTFKGVTRRLPTTMVCRQADLTRSLRIKNADILNKTDELIGRMRRVVGGISPFDLEDHDVDWVVGRIRQTLSNESFHLDFFEWGEYVAGTKSEASSRVYTTALNSFARYLGKRSLDINEINRSMIMDFMAWKNEQPRMLYIRNKDILVPSSKAKMENRQASVNVAMLAHIFNAARERYNDEDSGRILIPRQPFSRIEKPMPPSRGQKNLGQELMQRIIDSDTDDRNLRTALDIFILSFGTMGANMADLYNTPSFRGDTWIYNRQKTTTRRADRAEMRVTIQPELLPFVARLSGRGSHWLNVLQDYAAGKDWCTRRVNRYLKKWCETNGVPVFTFYAARHTWASLARKAGVEKATIDECLAHKGSFDIADIYAERSWDLLQEANRKVLDMFQWKREG